MVRVELYRIGRPPLSLLNIYVFHPGGTFKDSVRIKFGFEMHVEKPRVTSRLGCRFISTGATRLRTNGFTDSFRLRAM